MEEDRQGSSRAISGTCLSLAGGLNVSVAATGLKPGKSGSGPCLNGRPPRNSLYATLNVTVEERRDHSLARKAYWDRAFVPSANCQFDVCF